MEAVKGPALRLPIVLLFIRSIGGEEKEKKKIGTLHTRRSDSQLLMLKMNWSHDPQPVT